MTDLSNKRFIFTVTTGRSGSNFITEALGCLRNTLAVHEPKPRYDRVLRSVQHYPNVATEFLVKKKIPSIEKSIGSNDIYFESSHLITKGFLEAWLEIDGLPTPDLICLNRDHRSVSLSFNQLNSIPGRTINGLTYLLSPLDPNTLTTIDNIERFNNYQLCYWYCLEMEARKTHYREKLSTLGAKVVEVSVAELKNPGSFQKFREVFDLPDFSLFGKRRFNKLLTTRVNAKKDKKIALTYSKEELDQWEAQVTDALIYKS